MEKKQDLRIKRTYKLLSDALRKLMQQKEYEKITVKDICDEAMVHRTTFYTHFEDKNQLLKYCMRDLESPFDTVEIKEFTYKGYKDYYIDSAKLILSILQNNLSFYKEVIKKNKEDSFISILQSEFTEKIDKNSKMFESEGIKLPIPSDILGKFYSGACANVLCWWIENDMPYSVNELINYLDIITKYHEE